jgi:hypothetical protein
MLKTIMMVFSTLLLMQTANAQDMAVVAPVSETGENFDLYGVAQLFKDSEDLEAFEKAINDPSNEVNNLDLNEDGEVDYVRAVEHSEGNSRVIVMQAALGEKEFQDVATIEIEKNSDEDYVLQAIGNEEVYGEEYIVEPEPSTTTTVVHVHTWPIIRFVFLPGRRLWVSPWYWGRFPGWWHPWHPVAMSVHRSRMGRWHRHGAFRHTKVRRNHRTKSISNKNRRSSSLHKKKAGPAKAQPARKPSSHKTPTKKQQPKKHQSPSRRP